MNSTTSTGESPAPGQTPTPQSGKTTKVIRARKIFSPEFETAPAAGYEAGQILKDEAIRHLQNRRWKDAIRVTQAAQQLRAKDVDLYAILAVAGAHARKHELAEQSIRDLRFIVEDKNRPDIDRADASIAIASARLAQNRFAEADTEARHALGFDSQHEGAWWHLTAGFAGLGWFDQATDCLPQSTPPATTQDEHATGDADDEDMPAQTFAEWQVGRAINTWAMSKTPTYIVAAIGMLAFGLLGLAVAASTPFVVREIRVMRLDKQWKAMAEQAWKGEHRLRLTHAAISLAMLIGWIASLTIAS